MIASVTKSQLSKQERLFLLQYLGGVVNKGISQPSRMSDRINSEAPKSSYRELWDLRRP